MNPAPDKFERELARLSAEFVEQLPGRLAMLGEELRAWLSGSQDEEVFSQLSHAVHQLKGAGGTFGCEGVSDAARRLEDSLANFRRHPPGVDPADTSEVEAALARLGAEAARLAPRNVDRDGQGGVT